ncbi:frataxin, mitochondrial-like [Panonychus citri]|uniref:frataxin, mitochondrial-like n=1 Tax=Panonychus citri TaxID=50023 RepID=UPI002307B045|nr:frataxin, mitochondrial-like [Panonychus citri]
MSLSLIVSRSINCRSFLLPVNRSLSLSCCPPENLMDANKYEKLSEETLESLCQQFEEIIESQSKLDDSDVELSNGVLTVQLSGNGTYVINKQTPNRQIWLSSPFSGPKRYDWVPSSWIYKRDKTSIQHLLNQEISRYVGTNVNFDLDWLSKFE